MKDKDKVKRPEYKVKLEVCTGLDRDHHELLVCQ